MKKVFVSLLLLWTLVIGACGGDGSTSPIAGAGTGTGTGSGTGTVTDPAYFVSPNGSDTNAGTKSSSPFATLDQARAAMRGSTTKTTYLLAGTYTMRAALTLDSADNGESWLAYPGQTPVLDGNKAVNVAIQVGGDNITIRWLTIQNFTECGIKGINVSGLYIDSNTIRYITSTPVDGGQASVELGGSIKKGKITHNLIYGAGYAGIEVNAEWGDDISNLLIDMNEVRDTCTVADCGGIYVMDRSHVNTGVTITNNVVGNHGSATNQGVGIYLDDEMSNATVKSNLVYGTGNWDFLIHGGDHNTFTNNIFDISKVPSLGMYEDITHTTSATPLTNFGMAGNTFQCNIVYSSSAPPAALWEYGNDGLALKGWVIAKPAVSSNIYWGTNGSLPNTGAIVDSSPAVADPRFVDPAKADYHFKSGPPTSCVFLPVDLANVGPLPH